MANKSQEVDSNGRPLTSDLSRGQNKKLTTLSAEVQPASIEKAYEFRDRHSIRAVNEDGSYSYMSVCSTSTEELGKFSMGLQLYFAMLKYLAILFLVIGCMSVWPLVENLRGEYFDANDTNQFFDRWSLANQFGSDYYANYASDAEDDLDEIDDNQLRMTMADLSYTVVFLAFIIFFIIRTQLLAKRNYDQNITAADYCLRVKGLPETNFTAEEVKKHFSQFGEVNEVHLARIYDGLLDLYSTRHQLALTIHNERILEQKRGEADTRKVRMLERKLELHDEKIKKREASNVRTHDELPVIYGFVVFNSSQDSTKCLSTYRRAKRCCQFASGQPQHLQFRGHHPLSMFRAAEPDNILWENLEINRGYRCLRMSVSVLVTISVMIGSVALLYYMKTVEDGIPTKRECADDYPDEKFNESVNEAEDFSNKKKMCYCLDQTLSDLIDKSSLRDLCDDYIQKSSKIVGIKFATAVGVVLINFILKLLLVLMSKFERPSTKGREQLKIMMKVFVAMFINTAIVNLMVTSDLQELWFVEYLPFSKYLFNNEFNDFDRYWYFKSGSVFITTMLISIVSPHSFNLIVFYPLGLCRRSCNWRRHTTQHDLNQAFSTIEFDVATRTSVILNVVFTCFMYSGGMPFMNMICAGALVVIYWVDKYLVLRHYFKPSNFGPELVERVAIMLPVAVVLHCGLSLWMLSASEIFPEGYTEEEGNVREEISTFRQRIRRVSGVVNIILIIVAASLMVFNAGLLKIYERIKKRNKTAVSPIVNKEQGTYKEEYEKLAAKGVASYDINLNPKYAFLISTLNQVALENRSHHRVNVSADAQSIDDITDHHLRQKK
jgi:hypothetical protein